MLLSKEQEKYFQKSKIRDKLGNLLICYHGTPNPGFTEFNPAENKSQFGEYKFNTNNINYFTTNKEVAKGYTDIGIERNNNIYACYLNIENPYIVDVDTKDDMISWKSLKDRKIRDREIREFSKIFHKWHNKYKLIKDVVDELNKDLFLFNIEVRPNEESDDYFDLCTKDNNTMFGGTPIMYQYKTTNELFDDENQMKADILGVNDDYGDDDYYYTIDYIISWVLAMNQEDHTNYDGIVIPNIRDVGPKGSSFTDKTTDIVTLKSSNQIKSINNLNPTFSNDINESIGITFGDLDYGKKTDTIDKMLGRGTGHFGTGFYFVNKNGPNGIKDGKILKDYNESRPVYEIDLDKYNLYKPATNWDAYELHDALKYINNNFSPSTNYDFKRNKEKIITELFTLSYGITDNINKKELKKVWDDIGEDLETNNFYKEYKKRLLRFLDKYDLRPYLYMDEYDLNDYIKNDKLSKIEDEVEKAINNKVDSIDNLYDGISKLATIFNKSEDSILDILKKCYNQKTNETLSTRFMKALGYEGVDVTHLNHDAQGLQGLDNFSYGTVVYDLKPGTFKRIAEPRKTKSLKESENNLTYRMPREYINKIKQDPYFDQYELKTLPIEVLVKDNDLLNDKNLGSYHQEIWGTKPDKYIFDNGRLGEWGYYPPRVTKRSDGYKLSDGKHRIRSLYNQGYKNIELFVLKESIIKKNTIPPDSKILKSILSEFHIIGSCIDSYATYILTDGSILDTASKKYHNEQNVEGNAQHENIAIYLNNKFNIDDLDSENGSKFMNKMNAIRVTFWRDGILRAIYLPNKPLSNQQLDTLSDTICDMYDYISTGSPLLISTANGYDQISYNGEEVDDMVKVGLDRLIQRIQNKLKGIIPHLYFMNANAKLNDNYRRKQMFIKLNEKQEKLLEKLPPDLAKAYKTANLNDPYEDRVRDTLYQTSSTYFGNSVYGHGAVGHQMGDNKDDPYDPIHKNHVSSTDLGYQLDKGAFPENDYLRNYVFPDLENSTYTEITADKALSMFKAKEDVSSLRILINGKLVEYNGLRNSEYPYNKQLIFVKDTTDGLPYQSEERAKYTYTNKGGKKTTDTRYMPIKDVLAMANKIYLTDEEQKPKSVDVIQRAAQNDLDNIRDTGKHIKKEPHGYNSHEWNTQRIGEYKDGIEKANNSIQELEAKYNAGSISKNDYESDKSYFNNLIKKYNGEIKEIESEELKVKGRKRDENSFIDNEVSMRDLIKTYDKYKELGDRVRWTKDYAEEAKQTFEDKAGCTKEVKELKELKQQLSNLEANIKIVEDTIEKAKKEGGLPETDDSWSRYTKAQDEYDNTVSELKKITDKIDAKKDIVSKAKQENLIKKTNKPVINESLEFYDVLAVMNNTSVLDDPEPIYDADKK